MFWDSSAIVPTLFVTARSRELARLLGSDARFALWWATPVECQSAVFRSDRANSDGSGDVLHALTAHVAEGLAKLLRNRLMNDIGYAYTARLRETLESRGNVNAIAEDVIVVENDIPEINPETICNSRVCWAHELAFRHGGLDVHGASNGVLGGAKFRQHSVTRRLYDVAFVGGNFRIDQLPPVPLLTIQDAFFVPLDQSAVACHVGDKDRC